MRENDLDFDEIFKDVYGDSTLYAGMMVAVGGRQWVKEYVNRCVGNNGQVWRNPEATRRRENYKDSSSRDMFMGVLLGCDTYAHVAAAEYLRDNKGLLCPLASDNRNKVGIMGLAQLYAVLKPRLKEASIYKTMGWKHYLLARLAKPLLGPIALVEAATVYKGYQVNLVYCALMLYKRLGIAPWWVKQTIRFLRNVREMPDLVCCYLNGETEHVASEAPHMWNRMARAMRTDAERICSWPVDAWYFTSNFPSAAYCMWVQLVADEHKREQDVS